MNNNFSTKNLHCYACNTKDAKPRDIGGTIYFLCDECFEQHQMANLKAVEYLKNKKMKRGHRSDSLLKKNHRNGPDNDQAKENICPAYGCSIR
ncbi:MAG: hypothetical protein PHV50_09475 [Syntrophaceticus sp.]|nr:hypothetical protein [Syntrophaceticus sp.]